MKKLLAIGLPILAIGGAVFAYVRRYIDRLSFDVDLELQISEINWDEGWFVAPLLISIDNKNRLGVTLRSVDLEIYSDDNVLIAESNKITSFKVEGFINNKIKHDFKIYVNKSLKSIIRDNIDGVAYDLYIVTRFRLFLVIPVNLKRKLEFNK